jgi:hypothetical protein
MAFLVACCVATICDAGEPADELETLLKNKAKPELIAAKYEQLAREFKVKGDNNKAIQYFNKAA